MRTKSFVSMAVLLAAGIHAAEVKAQPLRLGEEFQVNTYTYGGQTRPSAGADDAGNFVIVWETTANQDGSQSGVSGQRYSSAGAPLGTEFQVNSYTLGTQAYPAVCHSDAGFVVAWDSQAFQDGSSGGVFAQRYSSTGAPLGAEFQVNSYTQHYQQLPAVACAGDGSFVVAWQSSAQDGSLNGIFAQRYSSTGAPSGSEFQVNAATVEDQTDTRVCLDGNGAIVAAWIADSGPDLHVFARRFDSAGSAQGTEFAVTSAPDNGYRNFGLDCHDSGFVVAWSQYDVGTHHDVFARRYDSSGSAVGSAFQVNSYTPGNQGYSSLRPSNVILAAGDGGDFTVVWTDVSGHDGNNTGLFAQRFDSTGVPSGTEFQVNSFTLGGQGAYQRGQTVAGAANGDFVVAWGSGGQDGSSDGVFAQRFAAAEPTPACAAAPVGGCHQPTLAGRGGVLIKKGSTSGGDKIVWEWKRGEETTLAELGDPVNGTTSYNLCVYDETAGSPSLVLAATAPAGGSCDSAACWSAVGTRGFNYVDPENTPDGIRRIVLRANVDGRARIVLKAKGPDLGVPVLPLAQDPRVRVQLVNSDGVCWEATYSQSANRNDEKIFRDKTD